MTDPETPPSASDPWRVYAWRRWISEGEARSRPAAPAVWEPPGRRGQQIAARYEVINEAGRGGVGVVSRALDRLTGRVITVKQLVVSEEGRDEDEVAASRSALAREFRLLTSLRHPNIISVYDYGFDELRQPYLVMDLEENAQTIIEAGAGRPLAVRVDLLVQTLRALVYLHRLGILHRDLKPDNILVSGERVKVLDFGFSIPKEVVESGQADWGGTPAYMAPEVLYDATPSERSDLYSVGMIAYELFTGAYPFDVSDPVSLCREIAETDLPRPGDDIDARLRPVLARLLAKKPEDRCGDAAEVIEGFGTALGQELPTETVTTRESFIQAAPIVGRKDELETLRAALQDATEGQGSAWLVGGESGVGKSRLVEELRTDARVQGVIALRGQAVSQSAAPYHPWRQVLANMLLRVDVPDSEAEVLKAAVPDIASLLGRPVRDAPPVDSEAEQARLLFAVEELLVSQPGTVVVIIEDLQWAGSESLKLFSWLAQPAGRRPLLLIGTYRDDEVPDLPADVEQARLLTLHRLPKEEIAVLGEAMIGPAARRLEVRDLLERETEGIPFFIVEVVRALAEEAGRLDLIGQHELPERVLAGGIQKVVRRRLDRLSRTALGPLETAAVVGREIDPGLMQLLHPELDLELWSSECAATAVLEHQDQRWRFAHDKLREQLLEDLSPSDRRHQHRRVAEAIEALHPDRAEDLPALAHHWRVAEEPRREADCAHGAGSLALRTGACREAVEFLTRARDLLQARQPQAGPRRRVRGSLDPNARVNPDGPDFRLGRVENELSEAWYRLGDLTRCRAHAGRALLCFGQPMPGSQLGWGVGSLQQIGLRAAQSLLRTRARDPERARRAAAEIARAKLRLTDTFFYALELNPIIWSSFGVVNQCVPAGESPELARGYILTSLLAGAARLDGLADAWTRRGLEIAGRAGEERDVAWVESRAAVSDVSECRFDVAEGRIERASQIAERVGDLRLWEETQTLAGMVTLFTGRLDLSLEFFRVGNQLSRRSGNRQIECWSHLCQGGVLSRLGRDVEALEQYDAALAMIDESAMKTETLSLHSLVALSRLRTGDVAGARESAERALWHVRAMRPVAYWLQTPLSAITEVALGLGEIDGSAKPTVDSRRAVKAMSRFARHLPLGRPYALLWRGLACWQAGRRDLALRQWRQTIEEAQRLGMPYEGARAHLEIGRHLGREDPRRAFHLQQAADWLDSLGCQCDLARVREEMQRPDGTL